MPSHFNSIIFVITLSIELNPVLCRQARGYGPIVRETSPMEMIARQSLAQGQLYSFLVKATVSYAS